MIINKLNIKIIVLVFIGCYGIFLSGCNKKDAAPDIVPPPNKDTAIYKKSFTRQPDFWWPEQKKPARIRICNVSFGNVAETMLAESVSGLAAQAVNEGKYDALIWLNDPGWTGDVLASYNKWFSLAKTRLNISDVQTINIWDVIDQMKQRDLIKGYVLYKQDVSAGNAYTARSGIDHSANMATTAAGVMKGVLISESLMSQAAAHGLKKLLDVRTENYTSLYQKYKEAINPNMTVHVDPKYPNHRSIAVAFNSNVFYGSTALNQFMSVVNPVSPALGWGDGNELLFSQTASNYGLFNTASNWCDNLLVTSADAHNYQPPKIKTLDPKTINFAKSGSFHSFIMSDGDNLQWMQRGFFFDQKYWANPSRNDFPMGWTSCMASLSETIPDALNYMVNTQPSQSTIIEAEGGYNYADKFGGSTADRLKTLRDFAKKLDAHMKKTGAKVLELICIDLNSQAAKEAYQIYAEEIENLSGIIAIQFSPYEGGDGKIFWPTNKKGTHIPVVTAKYSLWANLPPSFTRSGGPDKISGFINTNANLAEQSGSQSMDWTIVHAWSSFTEHGVTATGLTPVSWCVDKLNPNVTVVSPEELLWRIRMKYYPAETQAIIN